jgi:hypothetical protein
MPSNRFDVPQGTQSPYISQYVPLPLEEIAGLARERQGKHDKALSDLDRAKNILKIKADPRNEEYANQLQKQYNNRTTELANKIVKEGYKPEHEREINNLVNEFTNNPDIARLAHYHDNYYNNYVKDKRQRIEKGTYMHDLDPYDMRDVNSDGITEFNYQGMPEVLNYDETAKKVMGNIAKSGFDKDIATRDENGNIISIKSGQEGVLAKRVQELASQKASDFYTTPAGKQYVDRFVRNNPGATKEDVHNALVNFLVDANAEQIGIKTKSGNDFQYAPKYIHDEATMPASLVGQTLEGQTYNAIDNDQQFKYLTNEGILKKNSDGTVKVDWTKLDDSEKKLYTTYDYDKGSVARERGVQFTGGMEKQRALYEQMKKMADVVGFTGKLSSDNYDQVVSAYNTLSKARLFGEQLAAPVRNLESEKATANWEHNQFFDPTNINNVTEAPELKQGDKILVTERQTNSEGQMIKKGVIVSKDGTRTPFAIKPHSQEDGGFFDAIGKVGITSAKYQVGEHNNVVGTTKDGKKVVNSTTIPAIGTVHTIANDPKNRGDISYVLTTKDGEVKSFGNYSDLQRALEMDYYTKTAEGKADTRELLNRKQDKQINDFEE